jgi:hypothetical protein
MPDMPRKRSTVCILIIMLYALHVMYECFSYPIYCDVMIENKALLVTLLPYFKSIIRIDRELFDDIYFIHFRVVEANMVYK